MEQILLCGVSTLKYDIKWAFPCGAARAFYKNVNNRKIYWKEEQHYLPEEQDFAGDPANWILKNNKFDKFGKKFGVSYRFVVFCRVLQNEKFPKRRHFFKRLYTKIIYYDIIIGSKVC